MRSGPSLVTLASSCPADHTRLPRTNHRIEGSSSCRLHNEYNLKAFYTTTPTFGSSSIAPSLRYRDEEYERITYDVQQHDLVSGEMSRKKISLEKTCDNYIGAGTFLYYCQDLFLG